MCFERLTDDEVETAPVAQLLTAEAYCAVRNGIMAAAIVLGVLLVEGTPAWIVALSVLGAVVLGTLLHQAVLLAGAGVLRARARWLDGRGRSAA